MTLSLTFKGELIMNKHVKMPSIPQFRDAVKQVQNLARFIGYDENDEPIFNNLAELPVITAIGTVKLHGTNASVCKRGNDIWSQSKNNVLSPLHDNAGFNAFFLSKKDYFNRYIDHLAEVNNIDLDTNTISVFGEWAGAGVQGGVGISKLEKAFYIFGVNVNNLDNEGYWLKDWHVLSDDLIHDIRIFGTYRVQIDFNNPVPANNIIINMVNEVEEECPVSKHFGVSGIGEGIVFTFMFKGQRIVFKCKGDKHAGKPKVKTMKKMDEQKYSKVNEIVDKVTPEWRLAQMYQETFDTLNGGTGDIKRTGEYLKAVIQDVLKEEMSLIEESGITFKELDVPIKTKARQWFMIALNKEIMGKK
jgi:hypothetical protein